jgi:hypothetical protein
MYFNYGGCGISNCEEIGKFEVKWSYKGVEMETVFTSIHKAYEFYNSITEETKALWDMTRLAELVECHTWVDN